jgi:cytoskeletal protein CcmA (bactofilin family)
VSSIRPAAKVRNTQPPGNGSDGDHSSVVLGPRDRLVGSLYIEGDLRVVGTVDGELEVTGSVEIDDGGTVTGPVIARDRLVVGRAGSLKGDVRVARLVVQDGATFSGKVSMGKAVETPPAPVAPVIEPEPVKLPVAIKPPEAAKPAQPVKSTQAVKSPQPKPPDTKGKRR